MSQIPKEVRDALQGMLDQAEEQDKAIKKVKDEIQMMLVEEFEVPLTPCGMGVLHNALHGFGVHAAHHLDQDINASYALRSLDDFVVRWALARLKVDPNYLKQAEKAVNPDIEAMFQKGVPDLKVV